MMKVVSSILLFCSVFIVCVPCWANARIRTFYVEDLCQKKEDKVTIDLSTETSGILTASPGYYQHKNSKCEITLLAHKESSIVLSMYSYDIKPGDTLHIEDSDRHTIGLIGRATFTDERKSILTGAKIVIRFIKNNTLPAHLSSSFQFTFTEVNEYPSGECLANEFRCKNNQCLLKNFVCDGHNHCGDNSDQTNCKPDNPQTSATGYLQPNRKQIVVLIYLSIVAATLLIIVLVVFVIAIIIQKKKTRKTEQANAEIAMHSVSVSSNPSEPPNQCQPPATEHPNGAFYHRICPTFRNNQTVDVEVPTRQENIQVPAMYPNLDPSPSAPKLNGEDNASFNASE